jgi:hypothetical protein
MFQAFKVDCFIGNNYLMTSLLLLLYGIAIILFTYLFSLIMNDASKS